MPQLPERANAVYLKKQAKDLLRRYRAGDPGAVEQFERTLPAARALSRQDIAARGFRLHDAQSCIARDYGFSSWADLASYVAAQTYVEAMTLTQADRAARLRGWLDLVYGGDVTGSLQLARPSVARMLADAPVLSSDDPYAACAAGNEQVLRQTAAADPAWVNRPGGPYKLPPLVAVTHSRLGQIPEFRDRLFRSARCLLQAGADPNQGVGNRWPPGSLAAPDEANPLSALYGAAGVNRDPALTRLLLDAGASPNDGESLYHSLENPACTRLLLESGAHVSGTNALGRALDMPGSAALELLLAAGGDANEVGTGPIARTWGPPLLRAIAVRCSAAHVMALLAAGADPVARTPDGISAYRLARQAGLLDVAALLEGVGAAEPLALQEEFVAACARADAGEARRIQLLRPDLPRSLPPSQLRLLPDTVAWGASAAARVMVEVGWPIAACGGDWNASALNLAVLRGDPELTEFLLAHGASWRERQGYGDDVIGTLSWVSINQPTQGGDWAACARTLLAHGMPAAERDPADTETVLIAGRRARFSADVTEVLLGADRA